MLKSEEKLSDDQKTIKEVIYFSGIGLHSGDHGNVKIKPSTVDTGITFIRTDLSKDNLIKAHWSNVTSTKLCTTISNKNEITLNLVM